jgi:hypothetical protein
MRALGKGLFDLSFHGIDGLGDGNAFGTHPGTLEVVLTRPHSIGKVHSLETFTKSVVPGIVDESIGPHQGGRPDILRIFIHGGAGCRTARAEDAADHMVYFLPILGTLQPLFFQRSSRADEMRPKPFDPLQETVHIHNEILEDFKVGQRFYQDFGSFVLADELLACQAADTVDAHAIGPADTVATGHAIAESPVLLPLDPVEAIQNAMAGFGRNHIRLEMRLLVHFGIKPEYFQFHFHINMSSAWVESG